MKLSLEGRNVIVTGGSQGLGRATAHAYLQAGANVAILARRAAQLDDAAALLSTGSSGRVLPVVCDVTSATDLERAHRFVTGELGGVDVLINNAGTASVAGFESISDADWQADLDLKLFASVRLTRLVWPGMKERRWGRVINVLNTFSKAPAARTAPTSVTRAAGLALTKVLSLEGAPFNVLVNALLVGLVESEQTREWHTVNEPNVPYADFIAEMGRQRVPMGRLGRPEEFASTALFLGSEAASYLTGSAINVDGGSCPVT